MTQALTAGQVVHDTLTVSSADGTASQEIKVTITGSNDAASISGTATGFVTEAGGVDNGTAGTATASGVLTVADVDAGENVFQSVDPNNLNGLYGTFTFDAATGAWTYALHNALPATQALKAGEVAYDILTVASADGTASQDIKVTITSTNDFPVIIPTDDITVEEDHSIAITLSGNDIDGIVDSFTITSLPSNGKLYSDLAMENEITQNQEISAHNGSVTVYFKPDEHWSGDTDFEYYATDDQGGNSIPAIANISVTAVADVPNLSIEGPTYQPPEPTGLKLDFFSGLPRPGTNGSYGISDNLEELLSTRVPDNSNTTSTLGTLGTIAINTNTPNFDSGVIILHSTTSSPNSANAFRATGFIYLETSKEYTFSGYADDTFHMEIGGEAIFSRDYNQWDSYSGSYTPTESGYYSFEVYAYNGDGVGQFKVLVSVDGGAVSDLASLPTFLSPDDFGLHGDYVNNNGDGGYYPAVNYVDGYIEGYQDTSIALSKISASLVDTHGSEILHVEVKDIPVGAVLSDGINTFTSSPGNTAADVTEWNLNTLTVFLH